MRIETVRFSHILETDTIANISGFLSQTAFIVSHKSESIETLQGVLWYLPTNSPIIVVTNSPSENAEQIRSSLTAHLHYHKKIYVVHQKDDHIAQFFQINGVHHILGKDGKVVDGKGEGMYIGTLFAVLLGYPQWIIFYDADNFVPCALLEYTLAMGRLFTAQEQKATDLLHNVRICWSSKPEVNDGKLDYKLLGRCTSVISPIISTLLEEWFGIQEYPISSSNAGEQGMTIKTAQALRFSSAYSIETFQFIEILCQAKGLKSSPRSAILQQYHSKSPHFHTKREDEHVRKMIAQSLGSFFVFQEHLPYRTEHQLHRVCDELSLESSYPLVYPPLQDLNIGDSDLLSLVLYSEEHGEYNCAAPSGTPWNNGS